MRKIALLPLLIIAAAMPATQASALLPTDTNPLGSIMWLPNNANEAGSVSADLDRLVVVYDFSLDASGAGSSLLGRGPFGVKFSTASRDQVLLKGHSPSVSSIDNLATENGAPEPVVAAATQVDERLYGVSGDVRDGACSKVGTPAFSEAFSTTRSFLFPGTKAYKPLVKNGNCEVVESSVEVRDASGALTGFQTTVTNHVPGFWLDVSWPQFTDPSAAAGNSGYQAAELWYHALYDTAGDNGEFYQVADAQGTSESVGGPGEYDLRFAFTAVPGGVGGQCVDTAGTGQRGPDATFDDEKIQFTGTEKATFYLYPKGDWDLILIDPEDGTTISGRGLVHEQISLSSVLAGEYTMRACNFSGEPTVYGAVDID